MELPNPEPGQPYAYRGGRTVSVPKAPATDATVPPCRTTSSGQGGNSLPQSGWDGPGAGPAADDGEISWARYWAELGLSAAIHIGGLVMLAWMLVGKKPVNDRDAMMVLQQEYQSNPRATKQMITQIAGRRGEMMAVMNH